MAIKPWSAFLPEIMVEVPGVSDPLAEQAVRSAAIEFCDRAWVWRVDQEPLAVEAGIADYELEPPAGAVAVVVLDAWFRGQTLTPKTPDQLADLYGDWPNVTGDPLHYLQELPGNVLHLVPKPAAAIASALTAKFAVKPSRASGGIEEAVFEKYFEAICSGAKARLFAMLNKPWSSGDAASYHKGLFDAAVASAQAAATKGHVRAPLRVRAHFV